MKKKNSKKFGSFYSMSPKKSDGVFLANPGSPESISKFNNSTGDATGVGTSSTGGTSAGATSGCAESLEEEYLNSSELIEARNYIAKLCRISSGSIQIHPSGVFYIYNIPESDASYLKGLLMRDPKISYVRLVAGAYDFAHFDRLLQPTRKQTIQGQFTQHLQEGIFDTMKAIKNKATDIGNTFKGVGKAAIPEIKAAAAGRIQRSKDAAVLQGQVTKFLITALEQMKSAIIIFDNQGSLNQEKCKKWVERACGNKVDIFVGLSEILGKTDESELLKVFNQYASKSSSGFGISQTRTGINNIQELVNRLEVATEESAKHLAQTQPDKQLFGEVTYIEDFLKRFCPTYESNVLDCYLLRIASSILARKNAAFTSVSKVLDSKINSLNAGRSFDELKAALNKYEKPSTTKAELNSTLVDDLKYKRRFVCIVTDNEYKEIAENPKVNDVLKANCIVKNFNIPEEDSSVENTTTTEALNIDSTDSFIQDSGDTTIDVENSPVQLDSILNDLDNRLAWLVSDGMCSQPRLEASQIIIDTDPNCEVRTAVLNIINEICADQPVTIEEDGYTTIIY